MRERKALARRGRAGQIYFRRRSGGYFRADQCTNVPPHVSPSMTLDFSVIRV